MKANIPQEEDGAHQDAASSVCWLWGGAAWLPTVPLGANSGALGASSQCLCVGTRVAVEGDLRHSQNLTKQRPGTHEAPPQLPSDDVTAPLTLGSAKTSAWLISGVLFLFETLMVAMTSRARRRRAPFSTFPRISDQFGPEKQHVSGRSFQTAPKRRNPLSQSRPPPVLRTNGV